MYFKTSKGKWANFLAILMLCTSMGISIHTLLCNCTSSNYWSIITPILTECCSHSSTLNKKSCCKKSRFKSSEKTASVSKKTCCDSKFDYQVFEASSFEQSDQFRYSKMASVPLQIGAQPLPLLLVFPSSNEEQTIPPNKAPPKDRRQLYRHLIQVYLC
jgi:hypothetical protein